MKIGFRPLGNKIIVMPVAAEEKTAGGIIIPEAMREKLPRGEVIAVGIGKKDEPLMVKVGDVILFHPNAGQEINLAEGTFLMMNEMEAYGIFDK